MVALLAVVSRDQLVALQLVDAVVPRIQIRAVGWRILGRAGTQTLYQHTLEVVFEQQLTATDAAAIDAVNVQTAALRTALASYNGAAGRVEQIFGPEPLDPAQLVNPQLATVRLLLDCEVLA